MQSSEDLPKPTQAAPSQPEAAPSSLPEAPPSQPECEPPKLKYRSEQSPSLEEVAEPAGNEVSQPRNHLSQKSQDGVPRHSLIGIGGRSSVHSRKSAPPAVEPVGKNLAEALEEALNPEGAKSASRKKKEHAVRIANEVEEWQPPPDSNRSEQKKNIRSSVVMMTDYNSAVDTKEPVLVKRRHHRNNAAWKKANRALQGFALFVALLGGSMWQLLNIPDDPGNVVLDVVMIIATIGFLIDLVVQSAEHNYIGSFFFWMDVLGTLSMIFEISFLLSPAGKMNTPDTAVDTVVMRTARTAKLGARSARLMKLLKCLSFIFGSGTADGKHHGSRILSARLSHSLSTKAAMLSIMMALVVPLLQIGTFPEDDLSLRASLQRLENDFRLSAAISTTDTLESLRFQDSLKEIVSFYKNFDYFPYRIEGYDPKVLVDGVEVTIPGQSLLHGEHVVRKQNIVRQYVTHCGLPRPGCEGETKAAIYFDFTKPNQLEAAMGLCTMVFLVGVMAGSSFMLMLKVKSMVLQPIDETIHRIRMSTSGVLAPLSQSLAHDAEAEADIDDFEATDLEQQDTSELAMLVPLFAKLQRLVEIHCMRAMMDEREMEGMDDASKGVLVDILQLDSTIKASPTSRKSKTRTSQDMTAEAVVRDLPVDVSEVRSWGLDLLALGSGDLSPLVLHMCFDSSLGRMTVRPHIDDVTFHSFMDSVAEGYIDAPYHNFIHACDVLYTVHRLAHETYHQEWLPELDCFALLMAALCHDLGHQGKTNMFLVETRHELALRYNDKSPLENMHAAEMFKLCNADDLNVFKNLAKDDFKAARKVCVGVILHTDNCHHFEMVKAVREIYQLNSEACESQASFIACQSGDMDRRYVDEVLMTHRYTWLQLFLHLADVSNPLKPWVVCQAWAWRVLDEFFAQGDEEKTLGLPVGMLNDRDKINRPHSQHGFMKFLVAPLANASVRVFPSLHPLTTNMATNLGRWKDMWALEAKPTEEELAPVVKDVEAMKEETSELATRCLQKPTSRKTSKDAGRGHSEDDVDMIRTPSFNNSLAMSRMKSVPAIVLTPSPGTTVGHTRSSGATMGKAGTMVEKSRAALEKPTATLE